MMKKIAVLAVTVAMTGLVAGSSYADNTQSQSTQGSFADNTSFASNNDALSHNVTDAGNDKSDTSHNNLSTNNSFNVDVPISDSFNDNSHNTSDSNDDYSVNQAATGQVNLNDSTAGNINAADNCSTIFDGDVLSVGLGEGGGSGNINTGIITDSIQGDYSAQFSNTGVGFNNSAVAASTVTSSQTSNANLINP